MPMDIFSSNSSLIYIYFGYMNNNVFQSCWIQIPPREEIQSWIKCSFNKQLIFLIWIVRTGMCAFKFQHSLLNCYIISFIDLLKRAYRASQLESFITRIAFGLFNLPFLRAPFSHRIIHLPSEQKISSIHLLKVWEAPSWDKASVYDKYHYTKGTT